MLKSKKNGVKHNKKWGKEARNYFESIQDEFGITDEQGIRDLTLACDCLQRIRTCERIVEKEGYSIVTRFNEVRSHPLLNIIRDSHQLFLRTVKSLGLKLDENEQGAGKPRGSSGRV